LVFAFPTNSSSSFDYDAGFIGKDGIALSGISTNKLVNGASLTTTADSQTLTIQIDTEFRFKALTANDSAVQFKGSIVASRVILPVISSIDVRGGQVILEVQGTGPAPKLISSPDLINWTPETPTVTTNAAGIVLTLPVGGPHQSYRVGK
jgi:hypothetical protein